MFELQEPFLNLLARPTLIFLFFLMCLRLVGKKELGQMTPFDLLTLLLLSDAAQNSMVGEDSSVQGGMIVGGTLLLLNIVLTQVELRWPQTRTVIEGTPTLLIWEGRIIESALRREKVAKEELYAALRESGAKNEEGIAMAVLETSGRISVVKQEAKGEGAAQGQGRVTG